MPRETRCRACHAPVHRFTDSGLTVEVDAEPLSVLVDLDQPHYRHQLWHHLGPRVGWAPLYNQQRTWRHVHAQHHCATPPPARDATPPPTTHHHRKRVRE